MNLIFKNIMKLFKYEKLVFFVMLICVFFSALILNFSYGLYQNYRVQKSESEISLNEIRPEISENSTLSRGLLENYLSVISDETLNKMNIIYCAAEFDGFNPENYAYSMMRFCIKDGEYCSSKYVADIWDKQGLMVSGRFFNNEEEKNGKDVAIVGNYGSGWNEQTLSIKNGENSIELFGRSFQVIGEQRSVGTPIVPFLAVPADTEIVQLAFSFESNITKSDYDELKMAAEKSIPGILIFEDIEFPDTEAIYLYNNIMLISVFIAVLSVMNFAMLYHFILQERSRDIAIFRICGCKISKAVMIYLGECFVLSVPIYIIGMILYSYIMHNVLAGLFPYMEAAYSKIIYAVIFLIYFIIMAIILSILIYSCVRKSIIDEWKEGGR